MSVRAGAHLPGATPGGACSSVTPALGQATGDRAATRLGHPRGGAAAGLRAATDLLSSFDPRSRRARWPCPSAFYCPRSRP
jgi:hypothetical protein